MGQISQKIRNIHEKKVGVESAHSFGDTLFNIPLIKAIHDHYQCHVTVATRKPYRDGFFNVPWVQDIITISSMGDGVAKLHNMGYEHVMQITQNAKFPDYQAADPNHSLIDTPLQVGRELGIPDFDQKPLFFPMEVEIKSTNSLLSDQPTIAIESVAKSGQSWATQNDFKQIVDKYKNTHRILWLSNENAPDLPCVDILLRFSRREVIMCLRCADIFFSVGSGFFCASLALPKKWQPKKIVCLWDDSMYKYVNRLNQLNWHEDIVWVEQKNQLPTTLAAI